MVLCMPYLRAQVYPRPGFAIKTKVLETGVKVFVNVCQHERIGESGMAKKLDKDGLEVQAAFVFPLFYLALS